MQTRRMMTTHDSCIKLADEIAARQEEILTLLTKFESYEAARDEIERSLECLRSVNELRPYFGERSRRIASFLPVNLPLYSLVLFGVVPSLMSDAVLVRPPSMLVPWVKRLAQVLKLAEWIPTVGVYAIRRTMFLREFAARSEIVIFTGRQENFQQVRRACANSLVIHNGSGVNPIIIDDRAGAMNAVQKVVRMRVFNSGQDCAGPDAILVREGVLDDFVDQLIPEVRRVLTGEYTDRRVQVGPLLNRQHLPPLASHLDRIAPFRIYGGGLDLATGIVHPAIHVRPLREHDAHDLGMMEYFAPIFNVLSYRDDADLAYFFRTGTYLSRAMYVSVFGSAEVGYDWLSPESVLLDGKIVLDVERGNSEYGGFGEASGGVYYRDSEIHRPILIPREISDWQRVGQV